MRRAWNPEKAFKAYIDTIRALHGESYNQQTSGIPELAGAMAAGWNAQMIVETYNTGGDDISTSVALSVARRHTRGRHVCVVPDEETRLQYISALGPDVEVEVMIVGEKEWTKKGIEGVDFVVADQGGGRYEGLAKLSCEGAVLLCKNPGTRNSDCEGEVMGMGKGKDKEKGLFGWMKSEGGCEMQIVRDMYLPIGKGIEVVHVGRKCCCKGNDPLKERTIKKRWIKLVDRTTGEETVIIRR